MASGPLTMISVRLGSRSRSLIGLSSVDMSGMSAADGWEGARIMGQVLRKPQQLVSAKWTVPTAVQPIPVIRLPAALAWPIQLLTKLNSEAQYLTGGVRGFNSLLAGLEGRRR